MGGTRECGPPSRYSYATKFVFFGVCVEVRFVYLVVVVRNIKNSNNKSTMATPRDSPPPPRPPLRLSTVFMVRFPRVTGRDTTDTTLIYPREDTTVLYYTNFWWWAHMHDFARMRARQFRNRGHKDSRKYAGSPT